MATLRLTRRLGAWALKNLSMDCVRHSTDDELELDTSIGGNQSRFPETRRSVVINCHSADPDVRPCAAEALISAYWKPVYKYIRVRWSRSNEDAKDLTQAFFARAFEKQFFHAYDTEKAYLSAGPP